MDAPTAVDPSSWKSAHSSFRRGRENPRDRRAILRVGIVRFLSTEEGHEQPGEVVQDAAHTTFVGQMRRRKIEA